MIPITDIARMADRLEQVEDTLNRMGHGHTTEYTLYDLAKALGHIRLRLLDLARTRP